MHDMWPFTGGCFHSRECENYQKECGNCFYLKRPSENDLSFKIHQQKQKVYSTLNIYPVACSNWLGSRAQKSSLFHVKKVSVIPNSLPVEVYQPHNKENVRMNLHLSKNKFLLLFASANLLNKREKGFIIWLKRLIAYFHFILNLKIKWS